MVHLTRDLVLDGPGHKNTNVFVFDSVEKGKPRNTVFDAFTERVINDNTGTFIISDAGWHCAAAFGNILEAKGCYTDVVGADMPETLHLNPFAMAQNIREVEEIAYTFCCTQWDRMDPDFGGIRILIEAFALYMYENFPADMHCMTTFIKLIYSLVTTIGTEKGPAPAVDALFRSAGNKKSECLRKYTEFLKNDGEKRNSIGQKIIEKIRDITDDEAGLFDTTDNGMLAVPDFSTALFIDTSTDMGRFMFEMVEEFITRRPHKQKVFVIKRRICARRPVPYLHRHLTADTENCTHIVYESSLAKFMAGPVQKRYFMTIKEDFEGIILLQNGQNGENGTDAIIQVKGNPDVKGKIF